MIGSQDVAGAPLGPAPPFRLVRDAVPPASLAGLLEWALSSQADLAPSTVVGGVDVARRSSASLHIGPASPWRSILEQRLLQLLPELSSDLRIKPFDPDHIELELAAYNDGAFFRPHIDTLTGGGRGSYRRLSGVLYFFREPKGFEGGELRLHRFGSAPGREEGYVDLTPEQNAWVFFPSIVRHEVRPVVCASRRFEDSRFAINCWLHGAV